MASYIWITTSFEGIHKYNEAPREVAFLRYPHRHIFHVKVFIEVFHNDRDVEFILFKRHVNSLLDAFRNVHDGSGYSCEMVSDYLASHLKNAYTYSKRKLIIEINEDGENGSQKEYE